ncbi:MAG: Gfo/Idh/MocA family oxidoreductase, partial [Bacteroidota bacterium]|nr:Gfo/Idh/MocA family oxidoreductase [Bacteroidota bacterium]
YLHTEKEGETVKQYIPSERGNYADYFTGIYKSIREGGPVPVTAEDGLAVIRIINAAFKSKEQQKIIHL